MTPHRPGWRRQAPLLAFLLALAILILQNGRRPPSAIVLLSDGKTTTGSDPVAVASGAGKLRIPIHNRAGRGSEISASFAIGGLILLLSAGVASQRWAGRLP